MDGKNTFEINQTFLQKVLQDNESDPSLKIISVDSSAACSAGVNFMSNVGRLTVLVEDGNKNTSERNILVKNQISNPAWREAYGCDLAFSNEAAAYQKVLPTMKQFCGCDNLAFPQCLHASLEHTVLEDLKPMGFKMADRLEGLDLTHAKLALKELGRFHGTSLAMKHSEPLMFERLKTSVQEIIFTPKKKNWFGNTIGNSLRIAAMGLKVFRATGSDSLEDSILKLQLLKHSLYERLQQLVSPREPLSVICHGDFYINNIMFKYDDAGDLSEMMIVDLQAFRYASLSLDILYFMTSSLRPGVVSSHFEELMQVYHFSLNEQIRMCSPTARYVTLTEVLDEMESHSAYGLLMGLLIMPAITALPGRMVDVEKVESFSPEESLERGLDILSPGYFRRVHQIVTDYIDLGYL